MSEMTEAYVFREICENDFAFFMKHFLKVIEPETNFEWNWHMDILCHYCERVYYGDYQNIDINIPPRMMKSLIISVGFPCWVWTKNPSHKFIAASRSYDLSMMFNSKRRDLIESKPYQDLWPILMKDDKNTALRFENYSNGFMQAVSALGKITGVGADILISDDLLDAMDSFSKTKREAVNAWYSNAFYNRAQNKRKVKRININQRLHQKDVSGHLAENHNFHTLVIPMQMTDKNESTVDFIDPRKPGEFIHPERYGPEDKEDDYKSLGVYGWSSQYQQSPRPIGGGIIKEEWIRRYKTLPDDLDDIIIVGDMSFKNNSDSDYVSFQCWGKKDHRKYLIDLVRGKWSYKVSKEMFKQFCENNKNATSKYIEDKANGPALISDLQHEIEGIIAWPRSGSPYMKADKVQRLHLVSQEYEMGNVYLPEGLELCEIFVEELTGFTENGSTTGNDDMVDTSTMALLELNESETFFG